ncbi:MAG: hypothetical protein Q8Q14_00510 [Gemmatimonadales bacterium]|nr:hypothetical protein [Gemmatimonadales bacterium]
MNGWRTALGDCGGPFTDALLRLHPAAPGDVLDGARRRSDGVIELSADRVLRPSSGLDGDAFTRCPVAQVDYDPTFAAVFRAQRYARDGQLALLHPAPSAALLDALDVVNAAGRAADAYDAKVAAAAAPGASPGGGRR